GLNFPIGIEFGPDGILYVASFGNNKVPRYAPSNGAYLGDFVVANSGGINGPTFMIFRPPATPAVLPVLRISLVNTNISLAWTTNAAGFRLQETTGLSSNANWTSMTNSIVVNNDSNIVTPALT